MADYIQETDSLFLSKDKINNVIDEIGVLSNGNIPNNGIWKEFEGRGVNVKWFGAKGDGINDDSKAIQDAIAYLNPEGDVLLFPPGVYMQGDGNNPHYPIEDGTTNTPTGDPDIGTRIAFDFIGMKNIKVSGYGATIKSHPENSCIKNNAGFVFEECENIFIEGISYDGNIETRGDRGINDLNIYNQQSGFRVKNCKHMLFTDVVSDKSTMDGFTLSCDPENGKWTEHIVFNNCFARYNYRQGMSIVDSRNIEFIGGDFSYTGTIYGTSPMAGIDAEGYWGNRWINYRGVKFEENKGGGLYLHWNSYDCLVDGCSFNRNSVYLPYSEPGDYHAETWRVRENTLTNNTFVNSHLKAMGIGTTIKDNRFYFDKNSITTESIHVEQLTDEYLQGEGSGFLIDNNTIICDLIDVTQADLGIITLSGKNIKFKNNYISNVISNDSVLWVEEEISEFKDNTFIFDFDSRNPAGNVRVFSKTMLNNKNIGGAYKTSSIDVFRQETERSLLINRHYVIKTFPETELQKDYCVDLIIEPVGEEQRGIMKISYSGEYRLVNARGFTEERFSLHGDYLNAFREKLYSYGNINEGIRLSNIYKKGGNYVITVKSPPDTAQSVALTIERVSDNIPIEPSYLQLGSPYPYDSTTMSGLNFKSYYADKQKGATAIRPSTTDTIIHIGSEYYDTDLNKPIYWSGSEWRDANGTVV